MQKTNPYSVYIHINLLNGKRYVGITRQRPERRWQRGAGYKGTYFGNAIKKYGWDNFAHDVVLTGLTKEQAAKAEIDLIALYKTNKHEYGYNISEGGYVCDCLGGLMGEKHPNHQRVKMIDKETGTVIKVFGSQSGAARELGISRKGITKACQGKGAATYKGYVWRYADKVFERPDNPGAGNYAHEKQKKKVKLTEPNGKTVIFESVKDAAKYTGTRPSNISRFLKGYRADHSGRRWSYA